MPIIKTFIIDVAAGKASVFHFDDEICGFSCGLFTVEGRTLPALVYATFSGMVHVYYNVADYQGNFDSLTDDFTEMLKVFQARSGFTAKLPLLNGLLRGL